MLKRLDARLLAVLSLSALLFLLLLRHTSWLNGPAFWEWPWQRLDPLRTYPLLLLAAAPFAVAQWLHARRSRPVLLPLLLVMAAHLALQIVAAGSQSVPFSLARIDRIIEHPAITSYYTDAATFTSLQDWLGDFPDRMRTFHLHSLNKPPGPILYYVAMIRLCGDSASFAAGLLIGILSSASVPATFWLIRALDGGRRAAFAGASFLALCPGPILFFPELDQIYPLLVCPLIALWVLALKRDDWRRAVGFGTMLFVLTFFSFGLLVVGVSAGLLTLLFLVEDPRARLPVAVAQATTGLAALVVAYVLLGWTTGYDPLATLGAARAHQADLAGLLQRPYPQTVLFDLTDFAMGTGWIGLLLAGLSFTRRLTGGEQRVAVVCLVQILFVAVAGLIPTETARVWIFMMPLLMFPVGLELSRWSHRSRAIVFGCLWLLLAAVHQNLSLING